MWAGFERVGSASKGDGASHSQQETLADIEHISTIAGSLGSIGTISQCADGEPAYETDHTDLNSEYDETEMRRELMKDKWRQLFDAFDPEGFGEIPVGDFIDALKSPEFLANVPPNKRDILYDRALKTKSSGLEAISFQDFVNVMSGKRSRSFKCAVHHRDREVCSENDFHLIFEDPPLFKRMVHVIAMEVLPEERDRKYYADNYSCCPPPLFVILVTLVELGFFTYHTLTSGQADPAGPVPIDSMFIYRPDKRHEVWRFLFYMVLHAGWFHLGFNLVVQLLVGLPLEMVHGSTRIGCVYLAGVLAGSLGTSVFDPEVYLVGASGGVYALLAAHLANVMLNYRNMQYGVIRLLAILLFASCDVGFAIYSRYAVEPQSGAPSVSYVAHLTGALAGLTIGLLVLKNFEQKLHEQLLWWVALGVYAACTIFAVVYNLVNTVTVQRLEEEGEQVLKQHLFNNFGF
ncbi:protein rhomboid isoform X1 [Wyeomyia smithii]|uniref:protein rhomboid isoform X1 n=2 Tax=Wyeomyia smithii TaxID=174621 RepID=UPI002467C30F|nr:protein rhomboid isoform X1 [Wyeomyia smithii]XP_055538582.1 protein rhomboid isoform X1 [Wyeomyia smithii]